MKYLDKHKVLNTAQHGGHSCKTQLIQTTHGYGPGFTSSLNKSIWYCSA